MEQEIAALPGVQCPCPPSFANFVMLETPGVTAPQLAQALLKQSGLIIRPCDAWWGLTHHSRVTVGTTQQTDRFLDAMKKILADPLVVTGLTGNDVEDFY